MVLSAQRSRCRWLIASMTRCKDATHRKEQPGDGQETWHALVDLLAPGHRAQREQSSPPKGMQQHATLTTLQQEFVRGQNPDE